jgi:hypothetical protein
MKIVFIENRYKTVLFEKIAIELKLKGIDSTFLVQNKFFKPEKFPFTFLDYPKKHQLEEPNVHISQFGLDQKDRGFKYFNSGNRHYNYYYDAIKAFLLLEKPLCVFGESTLFHELIAIEVCKELGIKYLHPTSCRYPVGHMSFYENDTLIPFNESTNVVVQSEDVELAEAIAKREVVPEYMTQSLTKFQKISNKIDSVIRLSLAYYLGEKFNTPSPFKKFKLNKELTHLRDIWEKQASNSLDNIEDWNKTLLYPLQMQPEANLDVWGFPYNNQLENIKKLLDVMPDDWQLIIKPNPKSKFELNSDLIDFTRSEARCICISHEMKMDELFSKTALFFAVTGTICFECIFANKVVFSPALHHVKLFAPNQYGLPNIKTFKELDSVKLEQNAAELVAYLRENSFKGIVSDHFHSTYAYKPENITNLANAFNEVIRQAIK